MHSAPFLLAVASLYWGSSSAVPTPTQPLEERELVKDVLNDVANIVNGVVTGVAGDATVAANIFSNILQDIVATVPTNSPADIDEVFTLVEDIYTPSPTNLYENIVEQVANSLSPDNLEDVFDTYSTGINNENNENPEEPIRTIYPKVPGSKDPDYDISEAALRGAIYIPSGFTYGEKPPVILVPGSGAKGGETFGSNFIPLLTDVDYADPVWLNIPGFMLNDAQDNSEYIAYAIHYISAISTTKSKKQQVSLIGWSQANLDIQWVHKYWPSTVAYTNKHVAISPDYFGSQLEPILCPDLPKLPCPPAVIQQNYGSDYVTQLRANGGDSAYVPTTNVFSATDEIVQPQDQPDASAILNDAHGVGVSNVELQSVCNGKPAGIFYTHEGVLYNPVAFALAKDTLTNSGPGQTSRIDLDSLCQELVTDGLSLAEVVATEGTIPVAGAAVLAYPDKLYAEPALKSYATY